MNHPKQQSWSIEAKLTPEQQAVWVKLTESVSVLVKPLPAPRPAWWAKWPGRIAAKLNTMWPCRCLHRPIEESE